MYFQNFQYQECGPLHSKDKGEAQLRFRKGNTGPKQKAKTTWGKVSALIFSRPHQNLREHRPSLVSNLQCTFKLHKGFFFFCRNELLASLQESKGNTDTKYEQPCKTCQTPLSFTHHRLQSNVIKATMMKTNLSFLTLLWSFQTKCIKFAKFTSFVKDNQSNLCVFFSFLNQL